MRGIVLRPDLSPTGRTYDFNIELRGHGDVGLLDYTVDSDEYARIDFQCLVPGTLWVRVSGRTVLEADAKTGKAYVTGLFFPAGSRINIQYRNVWGGGFIAGSISVVPARDEALEKARKMFGVGKTYTAEELSAKYKKLAFSLHPDRRGGDATKFKELGFLYGLLRQRL